MNRYLDQKFDQAGFVLDVANLIADMRIRRAGYRHAYDAATRTKNDTQYDHDIEHWRNGEGEI